MTYDTKYDFSGREAENKLVSPWYEPPDDPEDELECQARATSLQNYARSLEMVQSEVHQLNILNAQLYSNRELASFDWGTGVQRAASLAPVSRVNENIIGVIIDTFKSQVGKNRPKATPMCRGASWKTRRQAKKLDKWLYGETKRLRLYEKGKRLFTNACVMGFGAWYCDYDKRSKQLCVENVFSDEIIIDQADVVASGKVSYVYRRRVLPVPTLARMFNVNPEQIKTFAGSSSPYVGVRPIGPGYAVLVEGWSVKQDGVAGRYMASCGTLLLKDEAWDREFLPFVFFQMNEPLTGFYSAGIAEQSLPFQIRLNEVNDVIRESQDIMCRPRIFAQEGTRINIAEFDNRIGRIYRYAGSVKPEAITWAAVGPELYNERDRCYREAFARFGLSAQSATGALPSGARLDSSEALREWSGVQDDRLVDWSQRFEQSYLDIFELMIRTMHASGGNYETTWVSGGKKSHVERIKWSEIDLSADQYVLQLEASSVFNMTPAAARDALEKQLANGEISAEEYRAALANPDSEATTTLLQAAHADISRVIELLQDGKFEHPEAYQDIENGVARVTMSLLDLRQYEDVPEEVVQAHIDWINAAQGLLETAASANAQGAPMPADMPAIMPGMEDMSQIPPGGVPPVQMPGAPPLSAPGGPQAPMPNFPT